MQLGKPRTKHSPIVQRLLSVVLILVFVIGALATPVEAAPHSATVTWRYTALGDSLAEGLWAFRGYVPRYRSYVQTDTGASVLLINLGVGGWTSSDLLTALKTDPFFRFAVRYSQIITFDIGGNDFIDARNSYKKKTCGGADNQDCLRAALTRFKENYPAIIQQILSLRSTTNTIIRTMDLYNPYVNVDKNSDTWPGDAGNDFQVFKPYVDTVNTFIGTTATNYGIPYARVYLAFNGPNGDIDPSSYGYIAWDGVHPNDTGHKKIADLLRGLGYAPLS